MTEKPIKPEDTILDAENTRALALRMFALGREASPPRVEGSPIIYTRASYAFFALAVELNQRTSLGSTSFHFWFEMTTQFGLEKLTKDLIKLGKTALVVMPDPAKEDTFFRKSLLPIFREIALAQIQREAGK